MEVCYQSTLSDCYFVLQILLKFSLSVRYGVFCVFLSFFRNSVYSLRKNVADCITHVFDFFCFLKKYPLSNMIFLVSTN